MLSRDRKYTWDDLYRLEEARANRLLDVTFADGYAVRFESFDDLEKGTTYVRHRLNTPARRQHTPPMF